MAYDPFTHRKKIPAFPSVFGPVASLRNDPARMKSGFTAGGQVNPGYAARVESFNKNLYKPADTRTAAETEQIYGKRAPVSGSSVPTGWSGPTKPVAPGQYTSRYGTASVKSGAQYAQEKEAAFGPGGPPTTTGIPTRSATAASTPQSTAWTDDQLDQLPEFPEQAGAAGPVGAAGLPAIPEPPAVGGIQAANNVPQPPSLGLQPQQSDHQFAGDMMSQFDDILKMVDGIGAPTVDAGQPAQENYPMSPAEARPPGAWNTPFNKTGSKDWGSRLDERQQSTGPAASSVRYYERAMARAQGERKDDRDDAERVRRLPLRFSGRPTNQP